MKKRIISLILALVMIGSILVSCGGNDGGGTDTTPDDIDFRISGAKVIQLEVGETYQLVINLSCEVVSAVEWFVSGEAASVSSGGLVTAISAGEATITAVYGEYSDSVKITVTEGEDEGEDDMESFEPRAEVLAVKGGASGIVVLQHDDAYPETAVVIDGLLAKYGLVADVAMLSNRVYNYASGKAKADILTDSGKNFRRRMFVKRFFGVAY